jgi:hypothetical protein
MKPMEPHELARWTRFAAKGGIGKCTAVQDCMAEGKEDLMFLKVGTLKLAYKEHGKRVNAPLSG